MSSDSVNSSSHEEEYQLIEDENTPPYQAAGTGTVSSAREGETDKKALLKKWLLIGAGIIVAAFCIYKLYNLLTAAPSAKPSSLVTQQTSLPLKTVSPSDAQAKTPFKETVSPAPATENRVEDKDALKEKMTVLEQKLIQNSQSEDNLQNQIKELSAAITEIQNNIALLTQQVNNAAKATPTAKEESAPKEKTATTVTTKVKKPLKKTVRKHATSKPVLHENYYVKAMIQGRAWLSNSKSATFTISTGDQLAGYGQIQEINPDKGIVTTSSGKTISFMPKDR